MIASGKENRRLPNWIDSFLRHSEAIPSPVIFRRWAAIGILSAALEKKVWARTKGSNLYPNLYTVLVGPPGAGKSQILGKSENMLRAVPGLFVAPSSLTTASMIDALNLAQQKNMDTRGNLIIYNSLQVVASELGVFLPAYDPAFMNVLTKLYDGELYEERRRTGKVNHIRIDKPQLSVLGGTTPGYLHTFLPDGAWDQGFTSRTIFVFSSEATEKDPFPAKDDEDYNDAVYEDLIHDLKFIFKELYGRMEFSNKAMAAISEWNTAGCPPVPEHGKLTHYNSRRFAHCMKLATIAAISRGNKLEITEDNFRTALGWLIEAEDLMPEIFKSMGVSGDAKAIQDAMYIVQNQFKKTNLPVGEHIIVSFLKDRVPSHSVNKIIEVMVRSHDLKVVSINGVTSFVPGPKKP